MSLSLSRFLVWAIMQWAPMSRLLGKKEILSEILSSRFFSLATLYPCNRLSGVSTSRLWSLLLSRFSKWQWSSFSLSIPDRCCIACVKENLLPSHHRSFCARANQIFLRAIFAPQSTLCKNSHFKFVLRRDVIIPCQVFASFALKGLAEYNSCDSEAKMWH